MQVQANIPSLNASTQPVAAPQATRETNTPVSAPEGVASTAKETQKSDNPLSEASVKDATKRLQEFVSSVRNDIQFSTDDSTGQTVVKVIDKSTQEVLRQIPSKEALEIAQALDRFQGLLVKQQA